jgi:SAM-dependent methyltransferase
MIMEIKNSHGRARDRFSDHNVAEKYPDRYRDDHPRDRREKQTVLSMLPHNSKNARTLDSPCGTGRLTRLLIEQQYTSIHCADISPAMINQTRNNCRAGNPGAELNFAVADIMKTSYATKAFDLIVCNRLFHHFTERETRLKALRELHRICNGHLLVSFYNRFSLSAAYKTAHRALIGRKAADRIPIPMKQFVSELNQAGFNVCRTRAVHWGISPHWYILAGSTCTANRSSQRLGKRV